VTSSSSQRGRTERPALQVPPFDPSVCAADAPAVAPGPGLVASPRCSDELDFSQPDAAAQAPVATAPTPAGVGAEQGSTPDSSAREAVQAPPNCGTRPATVLALLLPFAAALAL
jgi:hypothetical protein